MRRNTLLLLVFGIVTSRAAAQEGENLLQNFGFESGALAPWFVYGQAEREVVQDLVGAAVPETPVEGDHALRITLENAPGNFWEVGLGQDSPFEQGKVYTLSVFMKSALGDNTVNLKPEQGCCDFPGFGESQVIVGEQWAEFSVTTPAMAEDIAEGRVVFHLGFAPGTLWIDGVRFYEGEYVEPDFGPGDPLDRPCPIAAGIEYDTFAFDIDHTIRWRNGDTVPSRLDISRNGEVLAEDVDVEAEEFVDVRVPPGAYAYELAFEVEGEVCGPVVMDVDTCISGLFASRREEGVRLTWNNGRMYGAVLIFRDGEEIGDTKGTAQSFTDEDAPLGPTTYEVVPDEGICFPAIFFIDVTEPREEGENVLVNPGFEDEILEPWVTYGNVLVEAVEELTEATIAEDPVEGTKALRIDVPEAGANFWDAGLEQSYPFDEGVVYTLSAFVKSAVGERTINFKPQRGCCGFEGFGESQFTFGEEWVEFSVTTPPMPAAVAEGLITFHVAFSPGVFWMDGVRFYEGEYVPPDFEEPVEICDNEFDDDGDELVDCDDPDCEGDERACPTGGVFIRGDADADGALALTDGIKILNFLFLGGDEPTCLKAADANNNGAVDLTGAVSIFNHLFLGGPAPVAPYPACGRDDAAALTCDSFVFCE